MKKNIHKILLLLTWLLIVSCSKEDDKIPAEIIINDEILSGVQIGKQIWAMRNLNVSRYRNGDIIPNVQDPTEWVNLTTGAWCYYKNETANSLIYGRLYNAYAVNDPRGLAPEGWHVASDEEWLTLNTLFGETNVGANIKSTTGWNASNPSVTNSANFTALPGGRRTSVEGESVFIGEYGYWWTSTMDTPDSNLYKMLGYFNWVNTFPLYRGSGMSVRCIKD